MPDLTAATITVKETLDLLDGRFSAVARGVGEKRYALWLGSGISRERVDDLKAIIKRVLIALWIRENRGDNTCRFHRALNEAIKLAELSPIDEAGIDRAQPVDTWAALPIVLQRLSNKYAFVLDIRIQGEAEDYLLWEIIDVGATFAVGEPDCEHLCIAILAIEGVVPDIVSGNWDGLIEKAVGELTEGRNGVLQVCVRGEDLREPELRAWLVKFHGCAVRAAANPATYRSLLVGRQSQITSWPDDPTWAPIKNHLQQVAVTKPTLMIGLSAQDTNIQAMFSAAQHAMPWAWPTIPPAHVFAEDSLGPHQQNILKFVYRAEYNTHTIDIEGGATLRAYAKPLLTALVLHVLASKLSGFVDRVDAPNLDVAARKALASGILRLRDMASAAASGARPVDYIRALILATARSLSLFREGRSIPPTSRAYYALNAAAVNQIPADPALSTSGLRELASALGVLGLGEAEGCWQFEPGDPGNERDGVLRVRTPRSTQVTRLFFTANSNAELHLELNGIAPPNADDVLVIHSATPIQPMARSPRGTLGRTGKAGRRSIDMADLLRKAANLEELRQSFRIGAAI